MRGLRNKSVIVTGAGSGIGRAIAIRLVEEGMTVGVLDINVDAATQTVETCKGLAGRTMVLECDITNYDEVVAKVDLFEQRVGGIHVLVNNAGWDQPIPFLETGPAFWDRVVSINLMGALNMHHVVLPRMVAQDGGKVVNIASDAARVGSTGEAVYSACKGGLVSFTKAVAREVARNGIRLNVVCPGPTETPLFQSFLGEGNYGARLYDGLKRAIPLRRLGRPEDIPGIVAFLASDDADYITGQVISVSGGLTMHG
ncbi:MAG: glucose 1-dehydrogenase [Rhodospirillaceae bacterium]|nr:glucose 1-dehydrogenase [Rhodospirillaceae bacterium]